MTRRLWGVPAAALFGFLLVAASQEGFTQPPGKGGKGGKGGFGDKGPGGKGGFGPPGGQEWKLVKQFDKDGDGRLNTGERQTARDFLKKERGDRGGFGFGGPKGFGRNAEPAKPGPRVSPADVPAYPGAGLYEPAVLRTLFLEFETPDWEAELEDFHGTDVEVPCTLVVDGKRYPGVGVHFRGMSSYGGVPRGYKRSLNLSLDFADPKQRLYGSKTLNLLNAHEDPSFLSTVLYSHVARQFIPAPKANLVKVVINGESWGVYANAQQFDKEFLQENYKTTKGARWKVRGNPGGRGGLEYFGDNVADYKRVFEIKSQDDEKDWKALVNLCKVLNQTPPDKLEEALKPIVDLDGLLWFLALDVALINNDGYWVRASDFSLYRDEKGKFHFVPHDMNEAFRPAFGPGFGPPGGVMMRMGRPGEVLAPPLQDVLNLTDAQKKQLAELQKEVDGKLDAILTDDQKARVKAMREGGPVAIQFGGPGGFGPPPGGPPGGPGGFGPPGGPPGGPGMMGPRGGGGVELDPLVGLDDPRKPLRSKVLAVPALRAKYLANVRTIAEKSLDWKNLGPVVARYRSLIEKEVEADTRKLDSFEAFKRATADAPEAEGPPAGRGRGPGGGMALRAFADQRRAYLLNHPEVKKAAP
jgi:hypothetical protein